ncbi:MAG: hypothetical protein RLZZ50_1019 [Verrucomicrobiota bacterium]|jgi:UPF0271 protein
MRIDLNADVGEGGGLDAALFAAGISSANVACGAHAGDSASIAACCSLAKRHGVALGAHPGYDDREGFGRRERILAPEMARVLLREQLRRLAAGAAAEGSRVAHVKPHGALYHQANRDDGLAFALAVVAAVECDGAALVGPPEGALREAARRAGLRFIAEGFIDRAYLSDGTLMPRTAPGAVLTDETQAVAQALRLAKGGRVDTLCVHGDNPDSLSLLRGTCAALAGAGFRIEAPF